MEASVYASSWHGVAAWTLEGPDLKVVVVPKMGAKIVSLVDRRSETEWLVEAREKSFRPAAYGAVFTDQDMSGWDEMFPTIIACAYPGQGVFHGASLPDHGEAWCLPWQVTKAADGSLSVQLKGRALPYQLTRTIDFPEPAMLRLQYTLQNLSGDLMPYLWAAHPQFLCGSQAQVLFPAEVTQVINSIPESWGWGPPETHFGWPTAVAPDGSTVRIDQVGPPTLKRARKFFALSSAHPAWAAVLHQDSGQWVRFEWDPNQVPYLGLWVDEGALSPNSVAAPEPMTGWYDDLALAFGKGLVTTLPARETRSWDVNGPAWTRWPTYPVTYLSSDHRLQ